MRFFIINNDYDQFLEELYRQHRRLASRSFAEQAAVRDGTLFGTADFYPRHLRRLGHEALEVHINNVPMQAAWAREHCPRMARLRPRRVMGRYLPRPWRRRWVRAMIAEQVRQYRPDVVLNHSLAFFGTGFWQELRPYFRLLMGQHAATELAANYDWKVYDLMVSSFPPTLDWFSARGVKTELLRLGFEPSIRDRLQDRAATIPVSFVGSFYEVHSTRTAWLEEVCRQVPVQVWTSDLTEVGADSPIRRCVQGSAWGERMYQVLRDSRITLNHHGNVPAFANNMRLYEATGVGTLLLTDWKANLHEVFEPGIEVATYRDPTECVAQIHHLLDHEDERTRIAAAGQARTLRDHTYAQRMAELVEIVGRHMK